MRRAVAGMMLSGAILAIQPAFAADPVIEPLPPLRQGEIIDFVAPPPFYTKPNPLDVWQFYAVGRAGKFQARVALTPYGAYYLYNGQPFHWTSIRSRQVMPYIVD